MRSPGRRPNFDGHYQIELADESRLWLVPDGPRYPPAVAGRHDRNIVEACLQQTDDRPGPRTRGPKFGVAGDGKGETTPAFELSRNGGR